MSVIIRPAEERDIAAIREIEEACFSTPWGVGAILGEMQNGYSTLLLAEEDGKAIGWAGCEAICGEGSVTNIGVLPAARRRGIGRRLTQALLSACREQGLSSLTLEVRVSNTPAIALYESLGFCRLGIRPRFYERPQEDALLMRTELSDERSGSI